MKKTAIILLFLIAALSGLAQQKPVYERTRDNRVLSDYATWAKHYMGVPRGSAAPSFPNYVPDSLKNGSIYYRTGSTDPGLYVYDGLWKRVSPDSLEFATRQYVTRFAQKGQAANFTTLTAGSTLVNDFTLASPSSIWQNPKFNTVLDPAYNALKANYISTFTTNPVGPGTNAFSVTHIDSVANYFNSYNAINRQALSGPNAYRFDGPWMSNTDTTYSRSEGSIEKLSDGRLIHVYRRSAARSAEINNSGDIYYRIRAINGPWGTETLLYSSAYDDRNPAVKVTTTGRVIVWFRRTDNGSNVDLGYVTSTDATAVTWNSYTAVTTLVGSTAMSYGNPIQLPSGKLLKFLYAPYYCEAWESVNDGLTWTSAGIKWDYRVGTTMNTDETSIAYVGNGSNGLDGVVYAMVRDQGNSKTLPPFWFVSTDYGVTFNYIGRTNINAGQFGQSPFIYYDPQKNLLFTIGSQRNGSVQQQKLRFYINDPADLLASATAFTLKKEMLRPLPPAGIATDNDFYGYPSLIKDSFGNYRGVFSDRFSQLGLSASLNTGFLFEFNIKYTPTYYTGQTFPSEYPGMVYGYNYLNNKIEPQKSASGTIVPTGEFYLQTDTLTVRQIQNNTLRTSIINGYSGSTGAGMPILIAGSADNQTGTAAAITFRAGLGTSSGVTSAYTTRKIFEFQNGTGVTLVGTPRGWTVRGGAYVGTANLNVGSNQEQTRAAWTLTGGNLQTTDVILRDSTTAAGATIAMKVVNTFGTGTIRHSNTGVTVIDLVNNYFTGAAIPSTNTTATRTWNSYFASGNVYFNDKIAVGLNTPTALLHLKAGTATAGTAPLKLTAGTNNTTAESGAVEFDGNNFFGSTTAGRYVITKTLTATATLDFASTAAQSSSELTLTVTGAADGDVVVVSPPNAADLAGGLYTARVSATNTVSVKFANTTASALDPASGTFRVSVIKY